MCLLCVRMPGADINIEYLRNANCNNPDGSGFAILRSDLSGIDTFCSMDGELTIAKYVEAVERDPECWSMFHARYATHGTETVDNVHPFRVGSSKKTVLAHNGILPVSVPKGSKRSDTRIFAENILPSMGLGVLDDRHDFAALENWAAGSKIAVFSIDPRLVNNIYIVNEEDGHWSNGTWWSNSGYMSRWGFGGRSIYSYSPATCTESFNTDAELERMYQEGRCAVCDNIISTDYLEMDMCDWCNSCVNCIDQVGMDCMCYVPNRNQITLEYAE